jgi:hypothetical protein
MPFCSVSEKLVVGLSNQTGQTDPPYQSDWLGDPQLAQGTLYTKLSNLVIWVRTRTSPVEIQIPTVILFAVLVWSRTRQVG